MVNRFNIVLVKELWMLRENHLSSINGSEVWRIHKTMTSLLTFSDGSSCLLLFQGPENKQYTTI